MGTFSADAGPAPGQRFRTSICSARRTLSCIFRIFEECAIAQPTLALEYGGIPV